MTKATNALRLVVGEVFTNPQAMHSSAPGIALNILSNGNERMTAMEGKAFAAAFYWWPLRAVVHLLWLVYRIGRMTGKLPSASDEPWN